MRFFSVKIKWSLVCAGRGSKSGCSIGYKTIGLEVDSDTIFRLGVVASAKIYNFCKVRGY